MQEKIANKCCFGELGHPTDRTDVDMEKVAICLAEVPKKGPDGKLYTVFDIIDTPNGRILKTLCDYGCNIGISSRGQGDVITGLDGRDEVDPDTYECECFDAVLIPAVKSARLKYVTEDLDNRKTMKQALTEDLNRASEEGKKIMKETLDSLNIKLDEDKDENETPLEDEEFVEIDLDEAEPKEEAEKATEVEEPESKEEITTTVDEVKEVAQEVAEKAAEKAVEIETKSEKVELADETKDEVADLANDVVEQKFEAEETPAEESAEEEKEDEIEVKDDSEEVIEENVCPECGKNPCECNNENCADKKIAEAFETVEANNVGNIELINSLKEAIRSKADLENEVKNLQEKLAVSDTKVDELKEECDRYKKAVARLAALAKSNKDLQESISKLEESLKQSTETIDAQKVRISRLVQSRKENLTESVNLNESLSTKDSKITELNESLSKLTEESNKKISALNEQLEQQRKDSANKITELTENLNKATTIKEGYKKLANSAVDKYIEVKANMLGSTPKEIKRRLGETYTLKDVDQICEEMKSYKLNISKLPFNVDRKVSVKVNESVNTNPLTNNKFEDDDVDDDLMRLANL